VKRTIAVLLVVAAVLAVGLAQPSGAEAEPDGRSYEWVQNPDKDTYIVKGEMEPLGFESQIRVGVANKSPYHMLLHFELPEVIYESQYNSAVLRLFCMGTENDDASRPTLQVMEPISGNWKELTTNWDNAPGAAGTIIQWDFTYDMCDDPNGEWVELDATAVVGRWVAGDRDNNGFYIRPKNEDNDFLFVFQAKDHASPYPRGNQPQLVLDFDPPPSATPTASDTPTPSVTPTASNTPPITDTPTATPTATATDTPTPTPTPTGPPPIFLPIALKLAELGPPPEPVATDTTEPGGTETLEPGGTETPEPGATETPEPSETPAPDVEIDLDEQGDSGNSGTAALFQMGDDVEVVIGLAPNDDGMEHPAGVWEAVSCDEIADMVWRLEDIVLGHSSTTLTDLMVEDIANGATAIVVLAAADDDTVVACGMLPLYEP